jgi:hypothetical protein
MSSESDGAVRCGGHALAVMRLAWMSPIYVELASPIVVVHPAKALEEQVDQLVWCGLPSTCRESGGKAVRRLESVRLQLRGG